MVGLETGSENLTHLGLGWVQMLTGISFAVVVEPPVETMVVEVEPIVAVFDPASVAK